MEGERGREGGGWEGGNEEGRQEDGRRIECLMAEEGPGNSGQGMQVASRT